MKQEENKRSEIESLSYAIEGIKAALKSEAHMRYHFLGAFVVLVLSLIIDISKFEIMLIIVMITLVIFAELVNTAIEKIVDLVSPEYHDIAKFVKDVASGSVLVSTIGAVGVGYLIFYDRLLAIYFNGDNFIKLVGRVGNLSLIIFAIISIIVISIKAYLNKGTALEGGMPSGHSALAFSIFTIVWFISKSPRINVLVFIMALLVAQSRVKSKIHTLSEVFVGSLIGFGVTFIILEILYKFGKIVL